MKGPVLSTYKILKDKTFNSDIDESWVDWVIEMMQAGFESDSLYQLAGISKPYNQFELQELTNKVLKDLNLDYSDKIKTLRNYLYFLISTNIDSPGNYYKILKEIKDIYCEPNIDGEIQNLTFLYWAKDDLIYGDYQHYWEGANRENIDVIIKEQFKGFKEKFEAER